jgi:hypothetical protein
VNQDNTLIWNNPALLMEEWLPDPPPWPELAEMRLDHLRLLQERARLGSELSGLRQRFKDEDETRAEAMQAAYREGAAPELAEVTPPEERQSVLAEAEAHATAANGALIDFLTEVLERLKAEQLAWLRRVESIELGIQEKREQARRLLAEADAEVGDVERLRSWLVRAASGRMGPHVAWAHLAPSIPPEQMRWVENEEVLRSAH